MGGTKGARGGREGGRKRCCETGKGRRGRIEGVGGQREGRREQGAGGREEAMM